MMESSGNSSWLFHLGQEGNFSKSASENVKGGCVVVPLPSKIGTRQVDSKLRTKTLKTMNTYQVFQKGETFD
jgi:hypothetical protein